MVKKIPLKHFKTNLDFQMFIDEDQEWMYERIFAAIQEAVFSSSDYADIMKAKIAETNKVINMKSHRADWKTSLNLAIKWHIDQENYERCAEITNLIKQIC